MKKNDLTQIKGLDPKELRTRAKNLKDEIAKLVMDKNMKKLKDLKMISKKRKDVAQIYTILRQKLLLEQLESRVPPQARLVKDGKSRESSKEETKILKKGEKS